MKITLTALCFLCLTAAAFGQAPVLTSTAQPIQMIDHVQHASEHALAQEITLFGASPYTYAQGEVPLAELASPIYHTPLGDLAREARKEHATVRKANRISTKAVPVRVEVDESLGSYFKVTYDTGEAAEVSWSFVRETPPK